ncbi:oxidoreductase [Amycolatopsis sp. CA-230715]|uniref:oxidoreductase n=1 Tax=Amycolatopsis sp. CA-230715 TaxID=2745196 RepID=UPI001C02DA0B|nr:oxidoreductase [Amycolatopsis sp. CA-230715]QWF78597.1 Putative 2-dehydropantoate 2-reductase [Amycolatopsis sp. CA-230715]
MGLRIAIVGPGAIGATFASVLQRAGTAGELLLCGRTPLDGITVEREGHDPVRLAAPVRTDPASVPGTADWVLLTVKAHQTTAARPWLESLCGTKTVVAVLQNGVEHETRVQPLVPGSTVLPAVVWCPAEAITKQHVQVRDTPSLLVPDGPPGRALAELLRPGGGTVDPVADFATAAWRKLVVNAIAGLMPLTGRRAGMFQRADIRAVARALARECAAVARAEGADVPDPVADDTVDRMATMPPDLGSSILFDRDAGVALEWEARNDVVRRLGAAHGIPTPVSDVLVPLLAAASDGPG